LPLVIPDTNEPRAAHAGPPVPEVATMQAPVTVMFRMARQFWLKNLPIAAKAGFQKHPMKQ
jgi:hypothetical protein